MQQTPGKNAPSGHPAWDDDQSDAVSEPGPAFNEQSNLPPIEFPSIYVPIPPGTSDQQRLELIAQALAAMPVAAAAPEPTPVNAPTAPVHCAGAVADPEPSGPTS